MKLITPKELKKRLKNKEKLQLIDVREPYEHEDGAIDNLNIPMNLLLDKKNIISEDIPVVIYCQSGKRAAAIIYMLEREFKIKNLYSLEGGYLAFNKGN
jgi:rhodanese-related sulfurtransferase